MWLRGCVEKYHGTAESVWGHALQSDFMTKTTEQEEEDKRIFVTEGRLATLLGAQDTKWFDSQVWLRAIGNKAVKSVRFAVHFQDVFVILLYESSFGNGASTTTATLCHFYDYLYPS